MPPREVDFIRQALWWPVLLRSTLLKLTKKLVVSRWEAHAALSLLLVPFRRYMTGADEQTYCVNYPLIVSACLSGKMDIF